MRLKIFGPPGTGKTTTLRQITEHIVGFKNHAEELQGKNVPPLPYNRYSLYDVVYSTFTTSALEEFVVNRLGYTLEHDRKVGQPLRYFRTLHGIAFTLLIDSGLLDSGIARRMGGKSPLWHFKRFAKRYGLFFDPSAFGFSAMSQNARNNGNLVWMAISRAINIYYPTEGRNALRRAYDYLPSYLQDYVQLWEEYKAKNGVIDYNDMLIMAYDALKNNEIEFPITVKGGVEYSFKALIFDEFQDFSPLQFELFKLIIERAKPEIVVIAGDDDQSIYAFQGASPKFLLTWEADYDVVLRKSYRVPNMVASIAQKLLEDVEERKKKDFEGRGYKGAISRAWYLAQEGVIDRLVHYIKEYAGQYSIMILTRTNKQALKIAEELIMRGVDPRFLKTTLSWNTGVKGLGNFYTLLKVAFKLRQKVDLSEFEWRVALFFSDFNPQGDPEHFQKVYDPGQLSWQFAKMELKQDPIGHLNFRRIAFYYHEAGADVIKKILESTKFEPLNLPEGAEIYLDTIHASKGREADLIFLINEMPIKPGGKLWKLFFKDKESIEAEKRLWYVGLTRARKAVIVFTNPRRAFPDLLKLITKEG